MEENAGKPAGRLDTIIEEFSEMEPRERLECLLEFSDHFPELPDRLRAQHHDEKHRVHECQTPVYLWVELNDGRVGLYADVPVTAPTVRGFIGLLIEAFRHATPAEVLATRPTLLADLGLIEVLGMVRMQGLTSVARRIREEVRQMVVAKSIDALE